MAVETVRIIGLEGVVKTLRELGPAASARGGPIRTALRKAAKVIQQQVIANVNAIVAEENVGGLPSKSTGLLAKNIVITRGKKPAGGNGETVRVRVRSKPYPKDRAGDKTVTTAQVSRLLEGGSERLVDPHPHWRPAFDAKKKAALDVFSTELPRDIEKLRKKLARQNGVRE